MLMLGGARPGETAAAQIRLFYWPRSHEEANNIFISQGCRFILTAPDVYVCPAGSRGGGAGERVIQIIQI